MQRSQTPQPRHGGALRALGAPRPHSKEQSGRGGHPCSPMALAPNPERELNGVTAPRDMKPAHAAAHLTAAARGGGLASVEYGSYCPVRSFVTHARLEVPQGGHIHHTCCCPTCITPFDLEPQPSCQAKRCSPCMLGRIGCIVQPTSTACSSPFSAWPASLPLPSASYLHPPTPQSVLFNTPTRGMSRRASLPCMLGA